MKSLFTTLSLIAIAGHAAGSPAGVTQSDATGSDLYLVVFKSETLPADAAAVVTRAGARLQRSVPELGVAAIQGSESAIAALARDGAVLAVGPERVYGAPEVSMRIDSLEAQGAPTAEDERYPYQWNLRRIHAPALWEQLPLPGATPVVAVIDTGVMDDHPDLAGQVIASKSTSYCGSAGGPDDTAGYPIYSRAIIFNAAGHALGCGQIAPLYEPHGTHVAGIIAAKFGAGRAVGVDPDVRIAAYKVFDHARRTVGGVIEDRLNVYEHSILLAIVDATNSGYRVLNLSLGAVLQVTDRSDRASWLAWMRAGEYLNRRGVLLVASAGNAAFDMNGTLVSIPADVPPVIKVSASAWSELVVGGDGLYVPAEGSYDRLAWYSNFGGAVDLTAPGGDCGPDYTGENECLWQYAIYSDYILADGSAWYAWSVGTSMAAPHVSAVAAALRALHPDWDPGRVRAYLKASAEDLGNRQAFGHGMTRADQVR